MRDSMFWRLTAIAFVGGLFHLGNCLNSPSGLPMPAMMPSANASVGVATEDSETLFTASEDGRKIYMWQYYSSKPPKFLGEAEAILSR